MTVYRFFSIQKCSS